MNAWVSAAPAEAASAKTCVKIKTAVRTVGLPYMHPTTLGDPVVPARFWSVVPAAVEASAAVTKEHALRAVMLVGVVAGDGEVAGDPAGVGVELLDELEDAQPATSMAMASAAMTRPLLPV